MYGDFVQKEMELSLFHPWEDNLALTEVSVLQSKSEFCNSV